MEEEEQGLYYWSTTHKETKGQTKEEESEGVDEKEGSASASAVSKRIHKCSRCGGWGHHKNTCKEPLGKNALGSDAAAGGKGKIVQNRAARGRTGGRGRGTTEAMGRGRGGRSTEEGNMEQTSALQQAKEQELNQCGAMWERHKEQFRGEGSSTSAATGSVDNWEQLQIFPSQTSVNMPAARGRGRGRSVAIRGRTPTTRKTLSNPPPLS